MSNKIGEKFQITSFGSSHGVAVGAVVDGCPANLELTQEDIQKELDKRKPGTSSVTTPRKESDEVQILSGIFEGKTDGTPITGIVFNSFLAIAPPITWPMVTLPLPRPPPL